MLKRYYHNHTKAEEQSNRRAILLCLLCVMLTSALSAAGVAFPLASEVSQEPVDLIQTFQRMPQLAQGKPDGLTQPGRLQSTNATDQRLTETSGAVVCYRLVAKSGEQQVIVTVRSASTLKQNVSVMNYTTFAAPILSADLSIGNKVYKNDLPNSQISVIRASQAGSSVTTFGFPGVAMHDGVGWSVALQGYGLLVPASRLPTSLPPLSAWTTGYTISVSLPGKRETAFEIVSIESCDAQRRAFISIAYLNDSKDSSKAFVRAADTWEQETKAENYFDEKRDAFYRVYVRTAIDFSNAWNDLAQRIAKDNRTIVAAGVFTHSSSLSSLSGSSGLEFAGAPGLPADDARVTTVTREQIAALRRMPWAPNGLLILFGCNTAELRGLPFPEWSPASEFAKYQGIRTSGQTGWSYFSATKDKFSLIDTNNSVSTRVYLGAYYWHRNLIGIGVRPGEHMKTITFSAYYGDIEPETNRQ